MFYYSADFMICLTPNGIVRWRLFVEHVADMEPLGVSNIVSDRQGLLFYTISWSGDTIYTAKICRITHAQTSHPIQKCIENYQLFMYINTPLAINEKYDFLVTAVSDNEIDTVPAVLNKTTLGLLWVNRHVFGAGMDGHYRCDTNMGDIFWIGGDDRLLKFEHNGQNLINNYTQPGLSGSDFVLDKQQEIIVRPWQNMTQLPWKLLVSSHDVSTRQIKLRWKWSAPPLIADNDGMTTPTIDENGTVYMSSMPLAFAINSQGKTVWICELATTSEMKTYELISFCLTMNSKRRVLYIVSGSLYYSKSKFLFFVTAVNMDTGKVIKRIDLNVGHDKNIAPRCPILIGDEMFYFIWLTGEYPKLVPFKVTGIQQV
jgi:outer membrane protein assembly factor BamB